MPPLSLAVPVTAIGWASTLAPLAGLVIATAGPAKASSTAPVCARVSPAVASSENTCVMFVRPAAGTERTKRS